MILVKPLVFMFDTNYSSKMKIKNTAYVRRAPKFNKKKNAWKRCKIDTPKHKNTTTDFDGLIHTL